MNALKSFFANAVGGGIGAAVYVALTSALIYGAIVVPALVASFLVFGLSFGVVTAIHGRFGKPSLLSNFVCGLVTVLGIGFLIMASHGFAAAAGLLSPVALIAILVFSGLIGTGGHLVKKAFGAGK